MADGMNESTIRNWLGVLSFLSGLICFANSSTYDKTFGKLDFGGFIVYEGISLSIFYFIWGFKRIEVPDGFQSVVETILYVAICVISVELDKLVPGKSDALSILSYGLFALMSVSTSRKSELGFETGFFTLFLSLFLEELFKTNWKLLPIALVFCLGAILLRHRSISDDNHQYFDVEAQNPPEESLSSSNNEQNNQEESSAATHHPSSYYGQVSEAVIEEIRSFFSADYARGKRNRTRKEEEAVILTGQPIFDLSEASSIMFTSRKSELGFETGFFTLFLSLFLEQLFKTNWKLLPIALFFCLGAILLRHRSISDDNHEYFDVEAQYPPEEIFETTHHSRSNWRQFSVAIIEEIRSFFSARDHLPSNYGQVSEENILDGGEQEEDTTSSLAAESSSSSEQDHVSSGNNQIGWMHSSPLPQLRRRRRRMRMTPAIQNISTSLGGTLRRWHPPPLFDFFRSPTVDI